MWQKGLVIAILAGLGLSTSPIGHTQSAPASPKTASGKDAPQPDTDSSTPAPSVPPVGTPSASASPPSLPGQASASPAPKAGDLATSPEPAREQVTRPSPAAPVSSPAPAGTTAPVPVATAAPDSTDRAYPEKTAPGKADADKTTSSTTSPATPAAPDKTEAEKIESDKAGSEKAASQPPPVAPSAAPAPGTPAASDAKAEKKKGGRFVSALKVNGEDKGTQIFTEQDGILYIDAVVYAQLVIDRDKPIAEGEPGTQTIKGKLLVNPVLFSPGTTVNKDEAKGEVALILPGTSFGTQQVLFNTREKTAPLTSNPSVFLNYSVGGTRNSIGSVYTDEGVAWGTTALLTSYSWSQQQGIQRGLTRIEKDDIPHLRRFTFGDQFAFSSDGLGGSSGMAGFGVQRAFDLDPYLITLPQPRISGILQAPGTIDIYKDGVLVGSRAVSAGAFNLENLGVATGNNNLKVVIRDPFGGTREITQNFYAVQDTLAEGLTDYAYQLGISSPVPGQEYQGGHPVFLARQRWGLTQQLTAGYRVEGERGITNGGGSVDWGTRLGSIHFSSAASHSTKDGNGWANNLAYSFNGKRFSFSFGGSLFSDSYRKLGDGNVEQSLAINSLINSVTGPNGTYIPVTDATGPTTLQPGSTPQLTVAQILAAQRTKNQGYASVGYTPFGRLFLQAAYSRTQFGDGHVNKSSSFGASYDLHGISLFGGVSMTRTLGILDRVVTFNATVPLGSTTLTAARSSGSSGITNSIDAQHSLPAGTGLGYSAHLQDNSESGRSALVNLQAQNSWTRLNVQLSENNGQRDESAQLAGSVVYIGNSIHFGRPLEGSYALINVGDGIKGVPVISQNQQVATTGRNGSALVTGLQPYQNNHVGFDQNKVPGTDVVPAFEKSVNVPRYGGAVIKFNVHPLSVIRGVLVDEKGAPLSSGTVTALVPAKGDPKKLEAAMGMKGSFYLDDVKAGNYTLEAQHEGRLAKCPIIVPADKSPVYNLKTVHCTTAPVEGQ